MNKAPEGQLDGHRVSTSKVAGSSPARGAMSWEEEKAMMQQHLRDVVGKLNRAVKGRELAVIKANTASLQFKCAQRGLERCKMDAGRYQWLRIRGVRFPGSGEPYAHGVDADRLVDQGMKMDSYVPSLTEQAATQHRRWRDPENPVLSAESLAALQRATECHK